MPADAQQWWILLQHLAVEPQGAPLRIAQRLVAEMAVSGAGVSVTTGAGTRTIVCATDSRAQQVEDLQSTLGVGPCVDAVATGAAVLVPDVRDADDLVVERWPGLLEALDGAGVRALFAIPLRIGAVRIGAVDLYRAREGPLSALELQLAFLAADFIASALLDANIAPSPAGGLPWPGLSTGMHVHQATGMVQAQLDVDVTTALLALRARAFAEGRPLSDLARDVVERRLRFTKEAPQ